MDFLAIDKGKFELNIPEKAMFDSLDFWFI